jgi:hypothetical protein
MGDRTAAYRVLMGQPEGKRLLVRSSHRWKDNIKKDLQEVEWGMNWIILVQNRDGLRALANAVTNLRVP